MGAVGNSPSPETVEIAAGECRALVCPAIGGSVARLMWRGTDILRRAPDEAIAQREVRRMGCYPLVPYSNRIGHARLRFAGEEFALRPNFPPEPHAIHGVGWRRPWQVAQRSASSLRLELAHVPDGDWPFAFHAAQSIGVNASGLELRLELRNADQRPMPAGVGFHPYFPLRPGIRLHAAWQGCWEPGADGLPQAWIPVPRELDFRSARPIEDWKVDRCFTGWDGTARLEYANHTVEISAPAPLDRLVCYAPADGRSFVALEPVSHTNDAFSLAARGQADTGMRALMPGESLACALSISAAGAGIP